jgi:putative membrane protein
MHWTQWGMGFWPLIPLFWIGILALFSWIALRWFVWRGGHEPFSAQRGPSYEPDALEILRRRYARGEIDATAYDQMRERLEGERR